MVTAAASHIIHKAPSARLQLPSAPSPPGPPVITNAPLPPGRSPRSSKAICGLCRIFSELCKFTFPSAQMTGDDTAVDRCWVVALCASAPHRRCPSAADRCFNAPLGCGWREKGTGWQRRHVEQSLLASSSLNLTTLRLVMGRIFFRTSVYS